MQFVADQAGQSLGFVSQTESGIDTTTKLAYSVAGAQVSMDVFGDAPAPIHKEATNRSNAENSTGET